MNIQHVDYSSTDQRSLDYARERNSAWDVYSQPIQDNYYDQNQKITSSERDRQHGRDRSRRRDRERDKDRDRGSRYSRDKERDRSQNRHESDDYYDDSRSSFSDGNSYDNCDYNNLHNNGEDDYNSHITQNLPTASNKVCEVDDYYSDKRSSSYSDKKERHRDRDRERDRDSRPRTRDYDKDRDRDRDRREHNRTGTSNWKEEKPNNTIMLRGLAQHISEADIRNELLIFGLEAKDIRLMRKKDTGASRGFAFVEFQTLAEAVRWMELKQGVVTFQGQYRGTMHYSIPKDGPYDRGVIKADWNCTKCGAHNFKRRDFCFKCNTSREEADQIRLGEGYDEVSNSPCNTLLFRNLDILTTEEKILAALQGLTALPIKNIRVAKDTLTNTSRGFCYVELNSTNEAVQLHDQLTGLSNMLFVDGKQISLSFAKQSLSSLVSASSASVASAAVAAAQWTNQAPQGTAYVPGVSHGSYSSQSTQNYSSCSSNSYSDYQQTYNRNGNFNQNYSTSYNQYYNQYNYQNYEGSSDTSKASTNVSTNDEKSEEKTSGKSSPDSTSQKGNEKFDTGDDKALIYAEPDVSTYQYDESSGYYYDPLTGLYYDASSQYYYNSELQQFLYWDSEKRTYMPAPSSSTGRPGSIDDDSFDKRSKEKDKQDKVKIAKKIAKDMEKWAKTLNQKKEIAKHGIIANPSIDNSKQSATADAGFAMLEKKTTLAERQQTVFEVMKKKELEDKKLMPPPGHSKGKDKSGGGLVAAYGGESDSEDDGEQTGVEFEACSKELEEARLTDWNKLACLLCKRQFPSKEALQRHQQLSDLHKQNLEKLRRPRSGEMDADEAERKQSESKYRDRAKERRQKYGEPEHPHPNKLKEKYLKQKTISYEEPTKQGIGSDNIGNKMLKAMGWNEGQGLGRANQGRIEIIETQRRTAAAGLGMRGGTYGATAGDSYKDTVKKMMQTRFNELSS